MAELWPFRPNVGTSEILEWLTEILTSRTGEQRIALRPVPRQIFAYTATLEQHDFSRAKQFARKNANQLIKIPVWVESVMYGGTLADIDTAINFDTTTSDYRVGEDILIWESNSRYSSVEIATVSPTGVTLAAAIGITLVNPVLTPVRVAWATDGFTLNRGEPNIVNVSSRFQVNQNVAYESEIIYPQYQSLDVVTEETLMVSDITENLVRAAEYIDNGFGPVEQEPYFNYTNFGQMLGFVEDNATELWERRTWLHSLKGKQKAFWIPSFNQDFVLVSNVSAVSVNLSVNSIGELANYIDRHIMIELFNGTRFFREITNAANGVGDIDILTIDSNLGQIVNTTDVKYFCFITKVRLNSDSVQIDYLETGISTIAIPITEVPE